MGVPLLAVVPYDQQLAEFDSEGRPLVDLPRRCASQPGRRKQIAGRPLAWITAGITNLVP